jgi:uncharacterized phage infection (PIP) family protein YhgE
MEFDKMLTVDQKQQVLTSRIAQFAAEAYQHSLNKRTAEVVGAKDKVIEADKAIATLEAAIKVHQDELAKLAKPLKKAE